MKDRSLIQFLLDLLESFMIFKKWILSCVFIASLGAIVTVQWVLEPEYDAYTVLTPSAASSSGSIQKALGKFGGDMMGDLMGFSMGDLDDKEFFESIYLSKSFSEQVIQENSLREHYQMDETDFFIDVLKEYRAMAAFSISDQDAIELRYRSKDRALALRVIEYTVHLLDSTYNDIKQKGIQKKLKYIKTRLNQIDSTLLDQQVKLAEFQKRTGIYDVEEQILKSIEVLADLEAKKLIYDIDLKYEMDQRGKDSYKANQLKTQIKQFQSKIRALQNNTNPSSVILALKGDSKNLIDYERLMREIKVSSGVYAFLRKQAEQLEVDQQTNVAHLNVIDAPWVADKKSKPSKRGIVIVSFGLSAVLSQSLAFFLFVYRREDESNPYKAQIRRIFQKA